jgi:hypothetical protein
MHATISDFFSNPQAELIVQVPIRRHQDRLCFSIRTRGTSDANARTMNTPLAKANLVDFFRTSAGALHFPKRPGNQVRAKELVCHRATP